MVGIFITGVIGDLYVCFPGSVTRNMYELLVTMVHVLQKSNGGEDLALEGPAASIMLGNSR